MDIKKCNGCGIVKPVSEFGKEKRAKNGYKPRCRLCYNAEYNARYPSFKEKKLATCKVRYSAKKAEITQKVKNYYYANRVIALERRKNYSERNPEKVAAANKAWREINKEGLKVKRANYVANNKETVAKTKRDYVNKRLRTDPEYRLKNNMRLLLRGFVKNRHIRTSKKLGYSHIELLTALGKYPEYGEQIDHKVPVSWFSDMSIPHIINDLRNLQILSADENQKKNNKDCHPVDIEYFELITPYIKLKYINKLKWKHSPTGLKTMIADI